MAKNKTLTGKVFDPINWIWEVFASVKLAISLISALTLSCIVGSIVQQYDQAQKPLDQIYSPETLKWLEVFGLTDLFHSFWFVILIALLALNLTVCSLERLPKAWKAASRIPPPLGDKSLQDQSAKYFKSFATDLGAHEAKNKFTDGLKALKLKPVIIQDGDMGWQIFFNKGLIAKKAVWFIHVSLLFLMAGGVYGAFFGFEGVMNIPEGEKLSNFRQFKGDTNLFEEYYEYGKKVPNFRKLPFELELEKFDLQFWENFPGRPKGFKSHLNVYENGIKVHSQVIDVNDPLVWRDITFYQASYGEAGPGVFQVIMLDEEKKKKREFDSLRIGEEILITDSFQGKDTKITLKVVNYKQNYQPGPMPLGPAIQLVVKGDPSSKLKNQKFWVMKNRPMWDLQTRKTNFFFIFSKHDPKWFSGIQLGKDPGAIIVGIGSLCVLIGIFLALFNSPQRYWVVFREGKIHFKGQTTRSKLDFDKVYEKMFTVIFKIVT